MNQKKRTWSRKNRWIVGLICGLVLLPVILVGASVAVGMFNLFHAHEHCIKGTGSILQQYAAGHKGQLPYEPSGFGDAILAFLKDDPEMAGYFAAPGDDGSFLKSCLRSGTHVPEERCTRTYVQGLSETNNLDIAVVFDRYPTRGGDHFRRPWGPWLREVCLLDGSMRVIAEENWPAFRQQQIELLVAEGFGRADAEHYYHDPPGNNH